jgi:hypothetical protein
MKRKRFAEEQILAILKGAGGRRDWQGRVPASRHQRADAVSLEGEVRRDVCTQVQIMLLRNR